MKKIILMLMVFLFSGKTIAQNVENLKLRDTIYILFDEKQGFDDLHLKNEKNRFNETYIYIFPDAKYLIFNVLLKKEFKNISRKKRSFLNENKSKIITTDEIHSIGFNRFVYLLSDKKLNLFIIDKKDFKRKKIVLKRAQIQNSPQTII